MSHRTPCHDSASETTASSYSDWLHTKARVQLRNTYGSPSLAHIEDDRQGRLPGVDEEQLRIYAAPAETNRPVSVALARIPEITLTGKLLKVRWTSTLQYWTRRACSGQRQNPSGPVAPFSGPCKVGVMTRVTYSQRREA